MRILIDRCSRLVALSAAGLLLSATLLMADPVAGTLWFSGDPNNGGGGGAWGNDATDSSSFALTEYQEFTVTDPAGWTITDVYSLGSAYGETTGQWAILTGMGVGNPGTQIAGGDSAISVSSYDSADLIDINIGSLYLAQGNYWLEVTAENGAIDTTDGTNSIATTPGGGDASLRNWPYFSQYYQNYGIGPYSEGVAGIAGTPEPATWFSLAFGMAGMGVLKLGRRAVK